MKIKHQTITFLAFCIHNVIGMRRQPSVMPGYGPMNRDRIPVRLPDRRPEETLAKLPYPGYYETVPPVSNIQYAMPNAYPYQKNYIEIPYQRYMEQMPNMPAAPIIVQMPPQPLPIQAPMPTPPMSIPVGMPAPPTPMPAVMLAPPMPVPITMPAPSCCPSNVPIVPNTPDVPQEPECEPEPVIMPTPMPMPVPVPEIIQPLPFMSPYLPAASPMSPWLPPLNLLPPVSSTNARSNFLRKIPIPPPTL